MFVAKCVAQSHFKYVSVLFLGHKPGGCGRPNGRNHNQFQSLWFTNAKPLGKQLIYVNISS
jgi:hypothetical protein